MRVMGIPLSKWAVSKALHLSTSVADLYTLFGLVDPPYISGSLSSSPPVTQTPQETGEVTGSSVDCGLV
jgi:hypothetical protein